MIRPPKVRRLALGSGRRMEEAGEHRRYLQYNATQHSTIILISYLHMHVLHIVHVYDVLALSRLRGY